MTPIIDELPVFALVAAVLVIAVVAAERDPASAPVCPAGPLEGGITHIIDGDTIIVDDRVRLRLEGIAAPELHEPGGQASREVLAMIAVHTPLRCSLTGAASHERCVGSCADDQGRDLGWLLVSAGARSAWAYLPPE